MYMVEASAHFYGIHYTNFTSFSSIPCCLQFSRAASNARSQELARDVGLSLQSISLNESRDNWKSRCSIAETKDEINSQDGIGIEHFSDEEMDAINAIDFMRRKGSMNQIVTYIPFLEAAKLLPTPPRVDAIKELPVVQKPVRLKFDVKCDVEEIDVVDDIEDTNASCAQHLDTPLGPSSNDVKGTSSLPPNVVLKTSASEPSLSMIPLIAKCPTDRPCPLTMAPRRRTEQRSLKNQTRYTCPESVRGVFFGNVMS